MSSHIYRVARVGVSEVVVYCNQIFKCKSYIILIKALIFNPADNFWKGLV